MVIRKFSLTLFPFYQILSHGAGAEESSFAAETKEQNKKGSEILHKILVRTKLKINQEITAMDPNAQNQNINSVDPIRSTIAKNQTRDSSGKFVSKVDPLKVPPISVTTTQTGINTTTPPDLVNVKITNPFVYIKYWWKRIMANEGIDLRLRVKPLTVFGVSLIAFSLAFGLGGVVLPVAFPGLKINGIIYSSPTPTPETIWKDTALKGTLTKSNTTPVKFYLVTTSTEAVTLEVPVGFNLITLVGKRILAVGTYNSKDKVLEVEDIQDLEVLPTTPIPIPTSPPTPTPSPNPTPTPTGNPTPEPSISPFPSETPLI
ncbi:MAG: Hemolysin-type calcium-binding region [Parcubacteria group bacterium GW2011_GWA1_38_7]|nr:MAG: Hemolysin-type calcium-binding region [Parcubacteria group bacterium GW2011_GWA1_38_7]